MTTTVGRFGVPTLAAAVALALLVGASVRPPAVVAVVELPQFAFDVAPVVLGLLVGARAPWTPVGPALAWTGASTLCTRAFEVWGETATTPAAWWGADAVAVAARGAWPWQLVGFAWLLLVFPSGLLPGRRWRVVGWAVPAAALLVMLGRAAPAGTPADQPPSSAWQSTLLLAGLTLLLASLVGVVASVVARYRSGDPRTRAQLRWVMLAGASVPVLLAASWWLVGLGVPGTVAYVGFLIGVLVFVPAAVAVAVLRHDLYDVDRLVSASAAWVLTSLTAAAVFAALVVVGGQALGSGSRLGVTGAAFVTALVLVPLHARLHALVGRVLDRERTVMLGRVARFVDEVREGRAEPERVEDVLREALGDPDLRLLLAVPGEPDSCVTLDGEPADPGEGAAQVPLRTGASRVGVLVLGAASRRRVRRGEEVARAARLPIEVSRLRLDLARALADVRASRERLALAAADERRRLERDLHDGVQQQIVAVGMRLRSVQRRLGPEQPAHRELDTAVEAVEATLAELRRLAHGVRPARLDDGLAAALAALAREVPLEVRLEVEDVELPDVVASAAYYVAAEALANVLKHSAARRVDLTLGKQGGRMTLTVSDDGTGGAADGFGLTSMRDRVSAVGGELVADSPPSGGTTVTAVIPCAS